jgi:transcription initiation factor TFIID TATA-box-binding protein
MVDIINVVAGGSLNREVDLQVLSSALAKENKIDVDFTDENRWQLVIGFNNAGKILLYRTGSYIIRGGSDLETLEKTKKMWFDLVKRESIVKDTSQINYTLQNIVFSGELDQKVNLAALTIQLGMNNTEYEPEQFPGLIYRPENFSCVMLIFSSGKVIITGSTEQKEAEEVMKRVQNQLDEE